MISSARHNRALLYVLAVAVILSAFGAACFFMRVGVDLQDEPYQIMLTWDPLCAPMSPLAAWLGRVLGRVFCPGGTILEFRHLAYGMFATAVTATSVACYYLMGRRLLPTLFTAGTALWLGALIHSCNWMYSWENSSRLMLILYSVAFIAYVRAPYCVLVLVAGVFGGLAALCRVPNVLLLPLGTMLFLLVAPHGRRAGCAIMFALTFASTVIAGLLALYGSIPSYIEYWRANMITAHTPEILFKAYLSAAGDVLPSLLMLAGVYAVVRLVFRAIPRSGKACVAICIGFLISVAMLWYVRSPLIRPSRMLIAVELALIILIIGRYGLGNIRGLVGIVCLCVGMVTMAGSDMGLPKFLITSMFPLLIGALWPDATRVLKWFVVLVVGAVMMLTLLWRREHAFCDSVGFSHARTEVTAGPARGIYTSERSADNIHSVESVLDSLRSAGYVLRVFGVNMERFGWEMSTGGSIEPTRHEWRDVYEGIGMGNPAYRRYVEEFVDTLSSERVVVLVPTSHFSTAPGMAQPVEPVLDSLLLTRLKPLPQPAPGFHMYALPARAQ